MVMNKAEKEALESARIEAALRWPTEANPQPLTMKLGDIGEIDGWTFNAHVRFVERAWRGQNYSGYYRSDGTKSDGSRTFRVIYPTKRDAILAMRWALCREYAKLLRGCDIALEQEQSA